jgi:hypothetical protein
LYDLFLLSEDASLVEDDLVEAIRVAFISRATPLAAALAMLNSTDWQRSDKSLKKWHDFSLGRVPCITEDLEQVVAHVCTALRPFVERSLLRS